MYIDIDIYIYIYIYIYIIIIIVIIIMIIMFFPISDIWRLFAYIYLVNKCKKLSLFYNKLPCKRNKDFIIFRINFVFCQLGFIDVYSEDKQGIGQHGARIMNVSHMLLKCICRHSYWKGEDEKKVMHSFIPFSIFFLKWHIDMVLMWLPKCVYTPLLLLPLLSRLSISGSNSYHSITQSGVS